MGLLRRVPTPADGPTSKHWDVDVFLPDCAIMGKVEGIQNRLLDYLQAISDQVTLDDAIVRSLRTGTELTKKRPAIVLLPHVLFFVDCSEMISSEAQQALRIEKRLEETMINVGPFWIAGKVHVPSAGDLHSYLRSGSEPFLPVTGIRISGHKQHDGRTALVNRAHMRCILT
jgi:hypothetical protein